MAKGAATIQKKKKKKGMTRTDKIFLAGLVILAIAAGAYVLATWDWPTYDPADLVGTWLKDESDVAIMGESDYYKYGATSWTFGADGSLTVASGTSGDTGSGTYTVDGKNLTLSFGGESQTLAFEIRASKLTLGESGDSFTLTRAQ